MPDKGLPVDTRSGRIRQKYFLYLLPGVCRSPKPLAPGQYSLHEEGVPWEEIASCLLTIPAQAVASQWIIDPLNIISYVEQKD